MYLVPVLYKYTVPGSGIYQITSHLRLILSIFYPERAISSVHQFHLASPTHPRAARVR